MGSVARNRPIASVGNAPANRAATFTRSQTHLLRVRIYACKKKNKKKTCVLIIKTAVIHRDEMKT